jgi:outer membrane lipoprotein carrier protein
MMEKSLMVFKRIGLLLFIVASPVCVSAEEADEGKLLLDRFLNDVRTMSARFEQSLIDADNVVVEESNGVLEIQRPGRFRWVYDQPYEQIMVADGLNVWSYDVDLAQVTVKAQQDVLGGTPALLLGGTDNVLDDFEYAESFSDRGTVWIHLVPRSTNNGFTKIELGFDDGILRRMIFSDNLQQSTLIALFDVQINEQIPADHFEFVPPKDVDLVGVPMVADTRPTE